MKRVFLLLISAILIALSLHKTNGQSSVNPTDVGNQTEIETIKLFNGIDFHGWYTFLQDRGRNSDPKGVFTVQDGMIRISGEEWGCITTNEEFENYRLQVEFKWGELSFAPRKNKARDSGLLLHSNGKDGSSNGRWIHSIECQIIEGGTGDFIVVGNGTDQFQITSTVASEKQGYSFVFHPEGHKETIQEGRINWYGRDPDWEDTLGFIGKNDIENPLGEWNILECIANKDRLTVFLNGTLVNSATNVSPNKGKIQIQSEGAEVFIRRVEITMQQ